jgi:hypothetical protein
VTDDFVGLVIGLFCLLFGAIGFFFIFTARYNLAALIDWHLLFVNHKNCRVVVQKAR